MIDRDAAYTTSVVMITKRDTTYSPMWPNLPFSNMQGSRGASARKHWVGFFGNDDGIMSMTSVVLWQNIVRAKSLTALPSAPPCPLVRMETCFASLSLKERENLDLVFADIACLARTAKVSNSIVTTYWQTFCYRPCLSSSSIIMAALV